MYRKLTNLPVKVVLSTTVLLVYLYVFLEWLFFITKPSFFSSLSLFDQVLALFVSPLPLVLFLLLPVSLFAFLANRLKGNLLSASLRTLSLSAAILFLTSALFLMIDNFTYTVFNFGIVSSAGWSQSAYFIALLFLTLLSFSFVKRMTKLKPAFLNMLALLLFFISSFAALGAFYVRSGEYDALAHAKIAKKGLPNILFISADGLNSSHLSAYGYDKKTTPFFDKFKSKLTFFKNAFPNCGHTGCSLASLLSSKLPTSTKLVYPPDILKGTDSYQHLPGILKQRGYFNLSINMRHYADPFDLNLRDGFDESNARSMQHVQSGYFSFLKLPEFSSEQYFLAQMEDRLSSRLLHTLGLKKMVDAYDEATQKKRLKVRDVHRMSTLKKALDSMPSPFFAHIHFMGTHGSMFAPRERVFSARVHQVRPWMDQFYNDAILEFDRYLQEIVLKLKDKKLLRKTMIVIFTDHGQAFATNERIPLAIYFPKGKRTKRIAQNVQLLDIAPTILDYLGWNVPDWMEGRSLMSLDNNSRDSLSPIISVTSNAKIHRKKRSVWIKKSSKLIEGIGTISAVVCDRVYTLDFENKQYLSKAIEGHTAPCSESDLPSDTEMKQYLWTHLHKQGYTDATEFTGFG